MTSYARHGEIVGLKWADIDWERERILIWQQKTRAYKEIPLIRPLADLLKERQPASGQFVFTKTGHIFPKFYRVMRAACEHLGIPYGRWIEGGLLLHTARHTVTTYLVESGLDFEPSARSPAIRRRN